MKNEVWKNIKESNGSYQVSNYGRIGSFKNGQWGLSKERKILKSIRMKSGHLCVGLRINNITKHCYVHRLVLEAFVGPCPPGMECRHLDGNPVNNRLDNLRWGTKSENTLDKKRHGTFNPPPRNDHKGEKHPGAKLNEWQVRIIKRLFEIPDMTDKEIGEIFGVIAKTVNDIRNNKTWKHI